MSEESSTEGDSPHPKWRDARTVLRQYGLRPKKSFGQNFLVTRSMVEKIAAACVAEPKPSLVFEIGAGLGALTTALARTGVRVHAVERDRELIPILHAEHEPFGTQVVVHEADAQTFDYESIAEGHERFVLCGNLPYQITGQLLRRATELSPRIQRAIFMVQREVADRIVAEAGSDAYGALSVFSQAAFRTKRLFVVGRGHFFPSPNVDSAVVLLEPRRDDPIAETGMFQQLVHAAFGARRKTLRNAWRSVAASPEVLAEAAATVGIDLDRRGETLCVGEFDAMAQGLLRLNQVTIA